MYLFLAKYGHICVCSRREISRVGTRHRSRQSPGRFAFTGYFHLFSVRTNEMAKFGNDLTPPGTPRVHQALLLLISFG